MRYLLDTGFCRAVLRDRPPALRERLNQESARLAISTITLMALHHGVEMSAQAVRNRSVVDAFTARLTVLDYGAKAAMHGAEILAELSTLGTPIDPLDAMLAGHARAEGLILVTANRPAFEPVPGLLIDSWWHDAPS